MMCVAGPDVNVVDYYGTIMILEDKVVKIMT